MGYMLTEGAHSPDLSHDCRVIQTMKVIGCIVSTNQIIILYTLKVKYQMISTALVQ